MTTNYEDLANRSFEEIPKEQLLPGGSWLLKGITAKILAPKDDDGKPQLLMVYQPLEPMDDVDADELAALNNGSEYDLSMNKIYVKFWLETGNDYHNAREHFAKHGVVDGTNLNELIKGFRGSQVAAQLGRRTFTTSAGETKTEQTASSFTEITG